MRRHRRHHDLLLPAALALLLAASAMARRAPSPGGAVVVALPPELAPAFLEAHTFVPLLTPRDAREVVDDSGLDTVDGAPGQRSTVLRALSRSDGGRRWRLRSRAPVADVAHAVGRCLGGQGEKRFAATALAAAGVKVEVGVVGDEVSVVFSRPVGVLPELLTWCPLRPALGGPTGPYALQATGRLAWRSGSFEAPPLLGAIELRGPLSSGSGNERADVIVGPGADTGAGATLLSPWPDVIALVQREETAEDDPFGLRDAEGGLPAFRQALRADLLAAAWAAGRGGSTEQLLPPGVAPARPLASTSPNAGVPAAPLSLSPVPPNAPRLGLHVQEGDVLKDAVAERLAVLLRARRTLLDVRRTANAASADAELVRWRPPSRDAALALLSFVGEREGLAREPAVERALGDPRLLDGDDATRLAAALVLERALLESRLVVPLIVVERTVTVDADLRGVVLRGDGVPLLDGAWWGGGR
jgi:hypothetical protein